MIKNRFFMLGLGVGLLSGALLLQLMITAQTSHPTKEQLIQEAAKLNLKVSAVTDELLTKEEWAALEEKVVKPGEDTGGTPEQSKSNDDKTAQPAATPSPVAKPKTATSPKTAAAPSTPSTPKQTTVTQPEKSKIPISTIAPIATVAPDEGDITVHVPNGMTLSEVANLLSDSGVIQDKKEFLRAADKQGATKAIQYGKYSFNTKESLNSILDKLTTIK